MQDSNADLLTPNYLVEADPKPEINEASADMSPICKALRIKFNLRSSSYATMFLRELTRHSSAFDVQVG